MNPGAVVFAMLKADFLERTRRRSFLVTLCLILYIGYAVNTGQILIKLDTYRGVYNSAWVGSLMAVVITFFLGLTGFFLVKNTIERDERSGVGQILATTPLTRPQYVLGKWLSNLAVLSALVAILALAAVCMQLLQREAAHIDAWALLAPPLLIALPMMALVAALAVLFESVRWLQGGFGNLVYFGLFITLFAAGLFLPQLPWLDVTGFSLVGANMRAAARAAFPAYNDNFTLAFISSKALETFVWPGLDWTVRLILQRLQFLGAALGVALLAALCFDRFDPRARWTLGYRQAVRSQQLPVEDMPMEEALALSAPAHKAVRLTPLAATGRFHTNFLRLVWLECLLLVKGLPWYWLAGMGAAWLASAAAPTANLRQLGFMLCAIWPVLVWAKMGQREASQQAEYLLYQAPYSLARLLAPAWLAGVLLTVLATGGTLLGRLVYADALALLPWCLSVLFIPALALALGVWSRSSKLFEVVYPILWYLGPFNPQNGLTGLDYLGIHRQAPVNVAPLWAAGGIVLLLGLAMLGRRRQMQA